MNLTSERVERSHVPLTNEHFARLFDVANEDHAKFTEKQSEYAGRRVAVTLAQGAALHHLDGRNGVKDLDVWSFYAALPGRPWRFARRHRHLDFGPSDLGRQRYHLAEARSERERNQWRRWANTHTPAGAWTCSCAPSPYRPTYTSNT